MNKDKQVFQKLDWIIVGVILVIGMALRLYHYNTPLADYHSWRQADTAAVARNFARDGFNLQEPHYDDLTSIQSGLDNPTGLRLVEYPIYNAMIAGMYKLIPAFPIEVWGRIISALMSLTAIGVIYYLCYKESSRFTAIAAAITYATFPFFVFFSRTVLPENTAIGTVFLSILFLYLYTKTDKLPKQILFFIVSMVFFAVAILVKPTALFYGLVLAFLFIRKYRQHVFTFIPAYIFFILALLPFIAWRVYINQFPFGIPSSGWLFTDVETFEGRKNIFFKPAFFRWIFFERINNQILGGFMTFFMVLGALAKPKTYLLPMIALSGFVYLFVFQGGNVQHEYYQIILFPTIAILVGLGCNFLYKHAKLFMPPAVLIIGTVFCVALSWFFSYYKVRDFYGIPGDLVQIVKIVQTLTSPDDKIITDRLGDTTLLYLMDRKGSPAIYKDIPLMRNEGYKYLVVTVPETIKTMKEKEQLKVAFENDKFVLFRL